MNSVERQKEHFESISEKYFHARQSPTHLHFKNLMWTFFFKDKHDLRSKKLLMLEPMCGYSEGKSIVENYLGVEVDYEGFDYSDNLVAKAKEREPSLNISVQDVTKFQTDKKYDLIVIIGGLHHVPDFSSTVVNRIALALKPDGYFLNFEPTFNNLLMEKIRTTVYKENDLFDHETERCFSLKELNGFYSSANLKIADQVHTGLLSYCLYYNPDALPLLNIGGKWLVNILFFIDKLFFRSWIGSKLSFATLTLLKKGA